MPATISAAVSTIALALPYASAAALSLGQSPNEVYFSGSGAIAFKLSDHSIGNAGDWAGVEADTDHLTVYADRHGADAPASFFKSGLSPRNMIGDRVASDVMPSQLNFAMIGTLSMNVDAIMVHCPGMRIAQGNNGDDYNNWWIAGENCVGDHNQADGNLVCTCENAAQVVFSTQSDSSNHFGAKINDRCKVMKERSGYWTAVSAAVGTMTFKYTSSSESFTESDFKMDLTADASMPFDFGKLDLKAEESVEIVQHQLNSVSWEEDCTVEVPEGKRLYQWSYSITTDSECDNHISTMDSCYFKAYPINATPPCCVYGFETEDPNVCTMPGKNMCTGQ